MCPGALTAAVTPKAGSSSELQGLQQALRGLGQAMGQLCGTGEEGLVPLLPTFAFGKG